MMMMTTTSDDDDCDGDDSDEEGDDKDMIIVGHLMTAQKASAREGRQKLRGFMREKAIF